MWRMVCCTISCWSRDYSKKEAKQVSNEHATALPAAAAAAALLQFFSQTNTNTPKHCLLLLR